MSASDREQLEGLKPTDYAGMAWAIRQYGVGVIGAWVDEEAIANALDRLARIIEHPIFHGNTLSPDEQVDSIGDEIRQGDAHPMVVKEMYGWIIDVRKIARGEISPSPEYPYQDGDFIVLGPEVFVSADGGVICWRGRNYVPQDRLARVDALAAQEGE